jgi:hypothetical protein
MLQRFIKKTKSWPIILVVVCWLTIEYFLLILAFIVYTILFSQYGFIPLNKKEILDITSSIAIMSLPAFAGIKLPIIDDATRRWICWPIIVLTVFLTTQLSGALYFAALFIFVELFSWLVARVRRLF